MGIHSGPVNEITDLNAQANIAGAGINFAQRVMDCGDAGHILLSQHVADDLEHYPRWQPYLHSLGECEVKHGVRLNMTNLYSDEFGNPKLPTKLQAVRTHRASRIVYRLYGHILLGALWNPGKTSFRAAWLDSQFRPDQSYHLSPVTPAHLRVWQNWHSASGGIAR